MTTPQTITQPVPRYTKLMNAVKKAQELEAQTGLSYGVYSRQRGARGLRYYKVAVECPKGYTSNHYA